ncbi:hypothetical protein GCM10017673_38570 [Streptosporangium violaceochromogenes]|nr:hypothetical protein GCM10017673_38570 [Streptosporangium violaceochromogenes]
MTPETGTRDPKAMELATVALHAAMAGDTGRAVKAMQAISDETGGEGLMDAILAWCDTLIGHTPGIEVGKPVALTWMEAETRRINTGPDEVRPTAVWAARLIAARAADDADTFHALMESVPHQPPTAMGDHVWELVQMVALNLREAAKARGSARRSAPSE